MPRVQSASQWWLIGIGAVAALLVIVSVLINVIGDDGDKDLLAADTPEGTVQRYLLAISDDDATAAFGYISESLEGCTLEQFIQATEYHRNREFSASLERTTPADNSTLVTVKITEPNFDPPFGGGSYDFDILFTLVNEDGTWRFSQPPWPSWCPEERETPVPAEVIPPVKSRLQGSFGTTGNLEVIG